jgi:hypothetical protein
VNNILYIKVMNVPEDVLAKLRAKWLAYKQRYNASLRVEQKDHRDALRTISKNKNKYVMKRAWRKHRELHKVKLNKKSHDSYHGMKENQPERFQERNERHYATQRASGEAKYEMGRTEFVPSIGFPDYDAMLVQV